MNNLYEFGGTCDVVIRCNSQRIIGGKEYLAGEPYTILHDVYVQMEYTTNNSQATTKKNVLATRNGAPENIRIYNVTLTQKVCDLIATRSAKTKKIGRVYETKAENGIIYLPEVPTEGVYIYCGNEIISYETINENKIKSSAFNDSDTYVVFYNILSTKNCFNFDLPQYGWFELEIYGKGNTDKITEDVYIRMPACSLLAVPVFDMVQGKILNVPMIFSCITQNQEEPYFCIGE
jgi:hypothetical protein